MTFHFAVSCFNSFGDKFQTTFVACFFKNKLSIGKKFICKVKRLNVKQRFVFHDVAIVLLCIVLHISLYK